MPHLPRHHHIAHQDIAAMIAEQIGSTLRALMMVSLLCPLTSLEGCATTNGGQPLSAAAATSTAKRLKPYPEWLIKVAEPAAPIVGFAISRIAWRHGYLRRNKTALQKLKANLRPLDIMLFSSKGRLSGRAGSGLFGHAAVYLGSEHDLQQLGLWKQLPQELREEVRSGARSSNLRSAMELTCRRSKR
jgi:hypothetical protein